MRKLIYDLFATNEPFMALLPGGLAGDRAEGVPDVLPFGIFRHIGPTPGIGRHVQMRTELWVHSQPTDYTEIDDILYAARVLLLTSFPRQHEGVWLSEVTWEGNSGDLYDADRRTNTKYAAFLLNGSGL